MNDAWWPAPAKLNLFLHVLGRRGDGYHELQTVFQLLDFGDRVRLRVRADGVIRLAGALPGVAAADDLTVRAARLLAAHAGCRRGVDIEVDKRIPVGGGLGGGSSDAATALVALDRLDELATLGARLGADVPVFVRGRSAWAGGVGDRLEPVRIRPAAWYAVVTPPVTVPTALVFGAESLTRNTPQSTIRSFLRSGGGMASPGANGLAGGNGFPAEPASPGETTPVLSLERLLVAGHNDCEPVARALFPAVAEALAWLAERAPAGIAGARLTGTGASVFAAFAAEAGAREALRGLPEGWKAFAARGLDRSPLLEAPQP